MPEMEGPIYHAIQQEAQRLGCAVLAVNGMADHVHLLVKAPTRLSPAKIMAQIKGVSSHFANDQIFGRDGFRWQEGYGVFSVGRNQKNGVIAYIKDQKAHHAAQTTQPDWENTDEEYTP